MKETKKQQIIKTDQNHKQQRVARKHTFKLHCFVRKTKYDGPPYLNQWPKVRNTKLNVKWSSQTEYSRQHPIQTASTVHDKYQKRELNE